MSVISEVASRLVSQSIGTKGTTLFQGVMPMGVSEGVALYQMTQGQPIRAMGSSGSAPVMDLPQFQVVVRNTSFTNGEAKVKAVIDALDFYTGTLDSIKYFLIRLEYGPVYLGIDENNRHRWSVTFRAMKARS